MTPNATSWMYDREEYIQKCKDNIDEGRHFRVCGPRKVGKTTLLENLKNHTTHRVFHFNCQTTDDSPDKLINQLAQKVTGIREADDKNWRDVADRILDQLESEQPGCVLIFDEFSTSISTMDADSKDKFLNWFSTTLANRKDITFGIAGSISLKTALNGYSYAAKFREQLSHIHIWPFEEDIARGYIEEVLKKKGYELRGDYLGSFQDSIIRCLGSETLFPLFLRGLIEHCIGEGIIERIENNAPLGEIEDFVEMKYSEAVKSVVEALKLQKDCPSCFLEWMAYVDYIRDDLKKSIGTGREVLQNLSKLMLLENCTPSLIASLEIPGMVLDSLESNYLVKKESDNYRFYLKFLRDVWIELYPVDVGTFEED